MAENDKENNIPVQELEDGSAKVALELEKDPFEEKPEEKADRKSTRLNSSHSQQSRMPSSA